MSNHDSTNQSLQIRSGSFTSADPLVGFLYMLMRDHLTCGAIEGLMQRLAAVPRLDAPDSYTNGFMARYAADIADRLRPPRKPRLADIQVDDSYDR